MATDNAFREMILSRFRARKYLCIGLDTAYDLLPPSFVLKSSREEALFSYNREIIDATAEFASAFKPNLAFYEAEGELGLRTLTQTVEYIHERYPDVPVIADAKRGDIGPTNEAYCRAIFDELKADAVTVNPYLGRIALQPFLDRKEKGIIILVSTSAPGSGEFQDLLVEGVPLYEAVAKKIAGEWNEYGNCSVVAGATFPQKLRRIREIVEDMLILVPGVGAQGGDIKKTIEAGKDKDDLGLILSVSRAVQYASAQADFGAAAHASAEALTNQIAETLEKS